MKHPKTEQLNPRSRGLDTKSTLEILRLINREDATVAAAVRRELPRIARAVDAIAAAFRNGGRLFYIGAGSSGRMAFLDAAECPPTFGTPRKMVQAILAGGTKAMERAVEGAEDSARNGARDLARVKFTRCDVAVGIAASGTTPYVLGAMQYARKKGAVTVGITSNARSPLAHLARISITPDTGPEVVAGSTRMKAGTAQKMVLNMLSTTSMARLGKVYENWMVQMALTNNKLRRRGARILAEAAGVSASKAQQTLRLSGHELPVALVMLKTGTNARAARQRLAEAGESVRKAIASTGTVAARSSRREN